ncbi:MAG: hypothetical protein IJA80_02640 [Clostridia bacterium]|nr:hypothetical protein [Clostridia bacterium]MBQ4644190.1 hypothetical protein [Clostridia bacterium]
MTKQKFNKRKLFIIFMVIALGIVIIAGIFVYHNSLQGQKPFETLTTEDVKSISLYSVTGEIIYTFNQKEQDEIIKLLNGVAVDKEIDPEYIWNGGFDRQFGIEKKDGSVIVFGTSGEFYVDGHRYKVSENNTSIAKLRNLHGEYYMEYYIPHNAQG